ncbi:hypothetical protein [Proteus genomosp. 6]|uniref:hypothetical protein n=1 Tax=Proteus genomosp. 6 TaxID=1311820 RepID=UPI000D69ACB8|nr:hypothetical protein [Proteus genomosp. 6]
MKIFLIIITAIIISLIIWKRTLQKKQNHQLETLKTINFYLEKSGYELTPYGAAVSVLSLNSGYSMAETFSHVSVIATAQAIKNNKNATVLVLILQNCVSLSNDINIFYNSGQIVENIYNNDINAMANLVALNTDVDSWIDNILLSEKISSKDIVAELIIPNDLLDSPDDKDRKV